MVDVTLPVGFEEKTPQQTKTSISIEEDGKSVNGNSWKREEKKRKSICCERYPPHVPHPLKVQPTPDLLLQSTAHTSPLHAPAHKKTNIYTQEHQISPPSLLKKCNFIQCRKWSNIQKDRHMGQNCKSDHNRSEEDTWTHSLWGHRLWFSVGVNRFRGRRELLMVD